MGVYFNPSNASFKKDRNYEIYVDKTELIGYLNKLVGTPRNCLAVSHARRFGKSHAAGMIDAYYSLGCDSSDGLPIWTESTVHGSCSIDYFALHPERTVSCVRWAAFRVTEGLSLRSQTPDLASWTRSVKQMAPSPSAF